MPRHQVICSHHHRQCVCVDVLLVPPAADAIHEEVERAVPDPRLRAHSVKLSLCLRTLETGTM
jgi:hypothetical protein